FAKAYYDQRHRKLARFVSVQNHYNPIWREDERELIPLCRAEGIALIPYSPMARGYLCGRERRSNAGMTPRARTDDYGQKLYGRSSDERVADVVEQVAKSRGVASAQVALAWTLSRPGVTAPIFGATKVEHVDAAVATLALELGTPELQAIEV